MVNKLRGVVNAVAIKAPGFGERRKALLQDIAIVTGAEYVAKDLGMRVETTGIESLGTARKVSCLDSYYDSNNMCYFSLFRRLDGISPVGGVICLMGHCNSWCVAHGLLCTSWPATDDAYSACCCM